MLCLLRWRALKAAWRRSVVGRLDAGDDALVGGAGLVHGALDHQHVCAEVGEESWWRTFPGALRQKSRTFMPSRASIAFPPEFPYPGDEKDYSRSALLLRRSALLLRGGQGRGAPPLRMQGSAAWASGFPAFAGMTVGLLRE